MAMAAVRVNAINYYSPAKQNGTPRTCNKSRGTKQGRRRRPSECWRYDPPYDHSMYGTARHAARLAAGLSVCDYRLLAASSPMFHAPLAPVLSWPGLILTILSESVSLPHPHRICLQPSGRTGGGRERKELKERFAAEARRLKPPLSLPPHEVKYRSVGQADPTSARER